ncbi:MAG: hypothetical protein LAO06_03450 [Acidobacteriia bacterium]|nr:hypothetical protein [Terriglobia bacterium]
MLRKRCAPYLVVLLPWLLWLWTPLGIPACDGFLLSAQALPDTRGSRPKAGSTHNSVLQYRSGGHIIGFMAHRIFIVGVGYVLIEEFVDAHQVQPLIEKTGGASGGPTLARRVTYVELWKGVSVSCAATGDGFAGSLFTLSPGADPAAIKLKYNVDVAIRRDGVLQLKHPASERYFTRQAPVAWQTVAGGKRAVEVAFKDYGDHTIGFSLGEYDKNQPLVIDPH